MQSSSLAKMRGRSPSARARSPSSGSSGVADGRDAPTRARAVRNLSQSRVAIAPRPAGSACRKSPRPCRHPREAHVPSRERAPPPDRERRRRSHAARRAVARLEAPKRAWPASSAISKLPSPFAKKPTAKGDGSFEIALDAGRLRFVSARDGRDEGVGGIDVAVPDPAAALARAKARGLRAGGDTVEIAARGSGWSRSDSDS